MDDILILADPWDTLEHQRDSTLLLAKEAQRRGVKCYWTSPIDLSFGTEGPIAKVYAIAEGCLSLDPKSSTRDLRSFESIHWRADPPVTLETMRLWELLDATLPPQRMINAAKALLTWNEKHAVLRFRDWCIPSVITNSRESRNEFIASTLKRGQKVIIQPSGDAASRGVEILPSELNAAIKRAHDLAPTLGPWPQLQEMDDEILNGEIRLFVLNGKVAGCLKKTPAPHTPTMVWEGENLPRVTSHNPSDLQRKRANMIGKELLKAGVLFATIDFIGDRLLEINVTSPGLLHFLGNEESRIFAGWYWDIVRQYVGVTKE